MSLPLSTKAQTLKLLEDHLTHGKVLPVYFFTVGEFRKSSDKVLREIQGFFQEEKLVVRSSSLSEDLSESSNAGHFESILNVSKDDDQSLLESIKKVISSYDNSHDDDQVLIQTMLLDIDIAGVALTSDIDTLAPYYVINFEEGSTDLVTSGGEGQTHTLIHYKESPVPPNDRRVEKLIKVLEELQELFQNPFLDVEFAITVSGELYVFQTRPLTVANKDDLSKIKIGSLLNKVGKKINKLNQPHPNLLGDKTIFGSMPDWNPAEIIGKKPKKLALSLYKELITDSVWAYQRDNYGYRNLRSHPLLLSFLGLPYIDVRVSFNSFVPKSIDDKLATKLINHYLKKLESNPQLHDKVEFEIIHSCFYLNLKSRLKTLEQEGFSALEIQNIEESLKILTDEVISPDFGHFQLDMEKIKILDYKYAVLLNSNLAIIDMIYWLCEDCKRYGTLPFAGAARAGFIAVQFLKSFVEEKVITEEEYHFFLNSLNTVSKQLSHDLVEMSSGELDRENFKHKYGHLRPGTYDITSSRYDMSFEEYFPDLSDIQSKMGSSKPDVEFTFSTQQMEAIQEKLNKNGMRSSAEELISFIKKAIEGREYAKYIFTRSLSRILELIQSLCDRYDIDREESAFLDFKVIHSLYSNLDHREMRDILAENIKTNKEFYQYTKAIKLPTTIFDSQDIYSFYLEAGEPNFITLNHVKSNVICEDRIYDDDLEGRIVCIKSADPGFDFLFTKNIGGLITQFGGANSHMAIRCAELGIPAVIGAGDKNFSDWSRASVLFLDGGTKVVRVIS